MERSSCTDGILTPGQKIAYAEYLLDHGSRGRYEGAAEVARDGLRHIDTLQADQRLRLFTVLMQCPQGGLTRKQKGYVHGDTAASADRPSTVGDYMLRTYHGSPDTNEEEIIRTIHAVLEQETSSDQDKRMAHVLNCAYGERFTESLNWLLADGNEFSVTEGFRRAAGRMQGQWRAQLRLDQALQKVKNPHFRARLPSKRLEIYVDMICHQEETYDHRLNEEEDRIREAIREAYATVRRTAGAITDQVCCYFHIGRLQVHDGRHDAARSSFAKVIELSEMYGLTNLTKRARSEMQRVPQAEE